MQKQKKTEKLRYGQAKLDNTFVGFSGTLQNEVLQQHSFVQALQL